MTANINLDPSRFKGAEYERNVYVATVEQGTTIDTLELPAFWSHIAAKLRPWDKIEVRCDDGSFYAECIVIDADRTWAKLHVIMGVDLSKKEITPSEAKVMADQFEVKWRGPHMKHCVLRVSDGMVLQEGIGTKDEANSWKNEYIRTIAA